MAELKMFGHNAPAWNKPFGEMNQDEFNEYCSSFEFKRFLLSLNSKESVLNKNPEFRDFIAGLSARRIENLRGLILSESIPYCLSTDSDFCLSLGRSVLTVFDQMNIVGRKIYLVFCPVEKEKEYSTQLEQLNKWFDRIIVVTYGRAELTDSSSAYSHIEIDERNPYNLVLIGALIRNWMIENRYFTLGITPYIIINENKDLGRFYSDQVNLCINTFSNGFDSGRIIKAAGLLAQQDKQFTVEFLS